MSEYPTKKHENNERRPAVETHVDSKERHEASRQTLEEAEKRHRSTKLEQEALAKAAELAKNADKIKHKESRLDRPNKRHRGAPSKKQLKESFDTEMKHVRQEMKMTDRVISKVIHNSVVEKVSETLGTTLLRPNAMLSGSIAAFICITLVYFIARHYGYRLSGFETIAAFAAGWILGIVYDYFAEIIRKRKL